MLVWCVSGDGLLRLSSMYYRLTTGDFAFLPWGHDIVYAASTRNPFVLGGIHIVPDHVRGEPVTFAVAHTDADALGGCAFRRDAPLAGLRGLLRGSFSSNDALPHLCEHVVAWYARGGRDERPARLYAQLLIDELRVFVPARRPMPAPLRAVEAHVRARPADAIGLSAMARLAHVSRSTLVRLFRRELGVTPTKWLVRTRIDKARELLSTTGMKVGEIGAACGVHDPYYFSKLFRRAVGVTALEYRRTHALL